MSKTRDTGFINNIVKYDANGNVTIVSGSTTLLYISSSGAITTTGIISGSAAANATSASYATYAETLDGLDSTVFTLTSSFNAQTASFTAFSASILSQTASFNAFSASINTTTSSFSTRVGALESYTASQTLRNATYATTGSNTFTGTQYISNTNNAIGFSNTTSSIYTDGGLQVTKDAYISSSLYIKGNLTVYGTQSVSYITSSTLNISTNLITVNTSTPSVRFGGLAVQDSGSASGLTGSLLWDSQNNSWLYDNPSGSGNYDSAMVIMGPRNSSTLGSEQGLNCNYLVQGHGHHHTTSSIIFHDGTNTCIPNTLIGNIACFTGNTTFSNTVTVSMANYPQLVLNSSNSNGPILKFQEGGVDKAAIGHISQITGLQLSGDGSTPHLTISSAGGAAFSSVVTATQATFTSTANTYAGASLILKATGGTNPMYLTSVSGLFALSNGGAADHLLINSSGVATFASTVCAPQITSTGCINIGAATGSLGSLLTIQSANDQAGVTMYNTYACNKWSLRTGQPGVSNNGFAIQDDICNAVRFQITSNGNVGIGCITPSYLLDVNGQGRFSNSLIAYSSGQGLVLKSQNNCGSYIEYAYNTGGSYGYIGSAYHLLVSPNNITTNLAIRAEGDLILTTGGYTPRLAINSSGVACFSSTVCAPNIVVNTTSDGYNMMCLVSTGGDAGIYLKGGATNNGGWTIQSQNSCNFIIVDRTTGSNPVRMTIASGGIACFSNIVCAPQFTGGFICAVGGLNVRGASTTWSTLNIFPDNPGGAGAQCCTVLAGSFVGCSGWGPQLRFSGATGGFIDIGQDSIAGFVVETTDTSRLRVYQCGAVQISCVAHKSYILTAGSIGTTVAPILQLDTNTMYEIEYVSNHYAQGNGTAGWWYVKWHGYDGSGGAGQGGGYNFYMQVIQCSGTGEGQAVPTLFGCIADGRMYICYGNGYMTNRQLNVRRLIDDGSNNYSFL